MYGDQVNYNPCKIWFDNNILGRSKIKPLFQLWLVSRGKGGALFSWSMKMAT